MDEQLAALETQRETLTVRKQGLQSELSSLYDGLTQANAVVREQRRQQIKAEIATIGIQQRALVLEARALRQPA